MKACLLFPPATDPRAPHLALPSLAAFLRKAGIHVEMRDLDLESLLWLLTPERLNEASARLALLHPQPKSAPDDVSRLLALGPSIADRIGTAVASLRDDRFYDPHEYN